ncbi:uncharacterized protein A1O5_04712 [Cladophialophora psammophila CBS 110553]|uniref:RRM domain-containing protein n=1 Tax=Cladophialophora psammophila CBS 110553 TaxID=1182543 RepID=W9WW80_9EURO|nr:uncharacterized protein A1O5_04712 [Cladophialophora psammophila CBS 110553]EXJ72208.1 hypothetical protein A1O5_04712 [Cladophialophora psammophila CBS 110553]
MNAIRQTQLLNKRELENATPPSASWHADYRDTAWIYIGGLHLGLTEGDVVIIFSQYGNPTHLNLIRDKETGKSKGFAFLKYEDQRSCDLAVDNLGGAEVLGRLLRVDHTRYKKKDDEDEDTYRIDRLEAQAEAEEGVNENGKRESDDTDDQDEEGAGRRRKRRRHLLKEEEELEELLAIKQDGEEEDPMRDYLIREKREEVERAKERNKERRKHRHRRRDDDVEDGNGDSGRERAHRHRHRHRHRDSEDTTHGRKDRDDSERTRRDRREDEEDRKQRWKPNDQDSRYDRDRDRDRDREMEHRHRSYRPSSRERRSSRDYGRPSTKPDDY